MKHIPACPVSRLKEFPKVDEQEVDILLIPLLEQMERKIIVLDDDPTGIQTVHGVYVYTDWSQETFDQAFSDPSPICFILTNSRSFSEGQTVQVHRDIAQRISLAAQKTQRDFLIISRSDSTLRGHYPAETESLRAALTELGRNDFDGEIIMPFFKEGGRFTFSDTHFVLLGDQLVPAGETEFAQDKTFGFHSSHLGAYCEEKTKGTYTADGMISISLEELRALEFEGIRNKLAAVKDFNKVIVNAVDYVDVKIFCIALLRAMKEGKEFLFRSAAALPKVLGNISDRPYLTREDVVLKGSRAGGIVLIGSHVRKTSMQFEVLKKSQYPFAFIEFNQHLVLSEQGLEPEVRRVVIEAEEAIRQGTTVVVYTRRERFDLDTDDKEKQLEVSVKISDSVTSIIGNLTVRPGFIIAKGGITSSDVGVKALGVRKALVMGQVAPGVPVWDPDAQSKFPHMPYVIFPGNVGDEQTLLRVVENLM